MEDIRTGYLIGRCDRSLGRKATISDLQDHTVDFVEGYSAGWTDADMELANA